ncbi:MAG: DUF2721 domain-containing protein [Verrucomicrobiota bacterium]|nr:DUF2721 domain-containing protein [Verrucomicrobiota bacterium]
MAEESQVAAIAHVIQLSVAPVFLLAAVSGLLSVLTNRLGRIIDRSRVIEEKLSLGAIKEGENQTERLEIFSRRARLVNYSIGLCTACASMVCLVIISLFAGVFFEVNYSKMIGLLFIAAMSSLFAALIFFLREILLATQTLRIGMLRKRV